MRWVALAPGLAFIALSFVLPWGTVDGDEISVVDAGFGLLPPVLALLLAAGVVAAALPQWSVPAGIIATAAGVFGAYIGLITLRSIPTIGAVHLGADVRPGWSLLALVLGQLLVPSGLWIAHLVRRHAPASATTV